MDDKTFDSLLRLGATRTGRRRLLQAASAAGIGGLLTRGGAAAQDVIAQACQNRQTKCNRNRQCQCKRGVEFENVICDRLTKRCNRNRSGDRCCGVAKATCDNDCDCCRGYQCNKNRNECVRT